MGKLTREEKIKIFERRKMGETISSLAKDFNIHESNIKYLIALIKKHGYNVLREDKNKVYSKDFKLQTINRILINHESINSVAIDIGLTSSGILDNWLSKFKENGKIVTKEFLSKMKENSILINTARGELMDLEAVVAALESGHLAGAGIDTIEGEVNYFFKNFSNDEAKFKLEYPLFNKLIELYPRVLVTPHVGSYTDEAASNMIETSLENLKEYLDTGACKNDIKA